MIEAVIFFRNIKQKEIKTTNTLEIMEINFKNYFLNAAINYGYCSDKNINQLKTNLTSQAESNRYLNEIIESSKKDSEESRVALMLLRVCSSCDFKPKRKTDLEAYGIPVY
jgi:hypothetical protein